MRSYLSLLLMTGFVASSGCSTYRPATLDAVPLGTEIRVQLTDAGEGRVEDFVGREASEEIEGTLLRADADSVVFETWRADMVASRTFESGRITVPLGRAEVVAVHEKQFSAPRTVALATALIGVGYVLVAELFGGSEGTGIGGPDPGPVIDLLPLLGLGR